MPLFVYSASPEGRNLACSPAECIGVGKSAAVTGLHRAIATQRPELVVLFGVCGSYPGASLEVGDLCLVGERVFGDEGVEHDDGFTGLDAMGLGSIGPWTTDARRLEQIQSAWSGPPLPVVRCATVSSCSGTDARAVVLAARTGAQIETMESAAVAMACVALELPLVELRCVSNRTGRRDRQGWDLAGAIRRLHDALPALEQSGAFAGGTDA